MPATRATAAIVNERFVQRYSPDADPIGREVLLVNERTPDGPPARVTIVGIAPPLRQQIAAGHTPVVYVPFDTQPAAIASLLIRGNPERFAPVVRSQVRQLDADLPVFNLQSLERISYMSRWIPRIMGFVFSIVAIIATVLVGAWSLRADRVRDVATHAGDRRADGARRTTRRGVVVVSAPGTTPDRDRAGDWPRRCHCDRRRPPARAG